MSVAAPVYDSALRPLPVGGALAALWRNRGLLGLLVRRHLTIRYRRSALGAAWSLLNPVLTVVVLQVVFANVFRGAGGQVPYVVYLFTGIALFSLAQQTVTQVANSLLASEGLRARVAVPAEVFAFGNGLGAAANGLITVALTVPLLVVTGAGLRWSLLPSVLVVAALVAFATGIGLLFAAVAVRLPDALHLLDVVFYLAGFLTPTFYPIEVVPEQLRWIVLANPLTHFIAAFRGLAYGAPVDPTSYLVVGLSAALCLGAGLAVFGRAARGSLVYS